jgi:hypothetical protein
VSKRRIRTGRIALLSACLIAACRDRSGIIPRTPLGKLAADWLFAHNEGDGHAMVHFTLVNRGSAPMNGAQVDSAVYDGVRFARQVGPLTPVQLIESTDTSVVVLLRSKIGDDWNARFTSAPEPSPVKMVVHVSRGDIEAK